MTPPKRTFGETLILTLTILFLLAAVVAPTLHRWYVTR